MLQPYDTPSFSPSSFCVDILDGVDDLREKRVLILGPDVGIMCELIRRECRHVMELGQHGCPSAGTVDLVIVSSSGTPRAAACAVERARRALTLDGRIVVLTTDCPSEWLGRAIRRTLRGHGFSVVRTRQALGRVVFTAALNFLGSFVHA